MQEIMEYEKWCNSPHILAQQLWLGYVYHNNSGPPTVKDIQLFGGQISKNRYLINFVLARKRFYILLQWQNRRKLMATFDLATSLHDPPVYFGMICHSLLMDDFATHTQELCVKDIENMQAMSAA